MWLRFWSPTILPPKKATPKVYRTGFSNESNRQKRKLALPKKKRLVSFTMPRKKQNSKRKAYYWKPKMKSFSCVPMRKRKSKTAVLKSADRNEEYSRKKNLWTKNWKTSNAKRTILPANKKAWKNGLQKPKPSRIARWMFWNESQNSLGNRQRNTSCNIWKTNWCMKRQ